MKPVTVLYFVLATSGLAQNYKTSILDGALAPAVEKGAPAGSVAPSELERVNLFNGNLSVVVPLVSIGGRGEAGYTIVSKVAGSPFTTEVFATAIQGAGGSVSGYNFNSVVNNAKQDQIESPYSPGVIYLKRGRRSPQYCATGGYTIYSTTLTTVIFEAADGTTHELRDGNPVGFSTCSSNQNVTRQNRFRAMDDSGLTFVSSLPVADAVNELDPTTVPATGTLLFPNGVRYAVLNGVVTQIKDRNGNFVTLTYAPNSYLLTSIQDSQGRSVTVEVDKFLNNEYFDHIRYRGSGGALHEIRVKRLRTQSLNNFIRSDLGTLPGSFTDLAWGDVRFDMLPLEIQMTDGRKYIFRYTPYGELARMVNPAGGAVEYDHGAGYDVSTAGPDIFSNGHLLRNPFGFQITSNPEVPWRPGIYRRLLERRTYPDGGAGVSFTGKTTYSRRETVAQGVTGQVNITVRPYLEQVVTGSNVVHPVVTRHYFHEDGTVSTGSRNAQSPVQAIIQSNPTTPIALAHDRNAYEGVPYKLIRPGIEMTDTAFSVHADHALRPCQERRTLFGASLLVSGRQMSYDSLGNLTEQREFDFGSAPAFATITTRTDPANQTNYDVPQGCASLAAGFTRRSVTNYVNSPTYTDDTRHLQRLVSSAIVYGAAGAVEKQTDIFYDQNPLLNAETAGVAQWDATNYSTTMNIRGNPTSIRFAVAVSGSTVTESLTTTSRFDVLGNLRESGDANGRLTSFSFADNCWVGPAVPQLAYPTTMNFPTVGGLAMSTQTSYDCWGGKPVLFTDVNGVQTEYVYETGEQQFGRILNVIRAKGTNVEARQNFYYTDTPGQLKVRVTSALRSANDEATWAETFFDNFGRPVREVGNGIEKRTDYDGAERVWRVSHPSTTGSFLYTENRYDSGGRQTQTVRPDGTILTTSYDRNTTVVTDEAGVARGSTVDGLGRLVAVTEDPAGLNYTTRYAYDANDALLTVCPHGGALSGSTCSGSDRQRQFSYDRLARLKTVQNPEAALIEYFYDEAASTQGKGNLTRKVQQRGLSGAVVSGEVRYHYDEWNRPVSRVYSGLVNGVTTPNVTYRYDTHEYPVSGVTSYPKGRLTGVKSGGVEVALDSMDAQGRVTRSRQVTDGVSYRFGTDTLAGYEYFRQGGLARMRYPSGREVTYTVDDLGRAVTAAGLLGGQVRNYVQSVQYTAFGAVAEMRLNGTSLRERFGYNAQRLQMVGVDVERCANVACGTPEELLHLEYIYGSNNNGNPREQVIRSAGMNVRQRYDYDGLNRLRQFREEPAGGGPAVLTEDYCYDRHGNRAVLARPGLSAQTPQVTTCAEAPVLGLFPGNRIAGTSYDAGGELGSDGWNGLRFDLEGRLRKSIPGSGAETSYEYDGEGRRVVKQTGLSRTVFVYDAAGQLAAEYGSTVSESRTEFVHGDMLGSTRLVTDGTVAGRRFDYWPFGAELTAADTPYRTVGFTGAGPAQRFTGKERDGETGLDYFGARYLSGAQGRFTSADAPFADQQADDPQSWNLYSYVGNRPLSYVDEDGRGKLGVFYKVVLKPIMKEGREVMYRKTTEVRLSRDEARRLLRKEGGNIVAPGRKSAKNVAGKGSKEHGAHGKGAGEDGPHFHTSEHNGGHSFYNSGAIIPGASLGKDIFGDNLLGEAVDLFNPLSDIQSAIDIYTDIFGPLQAEPANSKEPASKKPVTPSPSKKPRTPEVAKPKTPRQCNQLDGQPCGGGV